MRLPCVMMADSASAVARYVLSVLGLPISTTFLCGAGAPATARLTLTVKFIKLAWRHDGGVLP